MRLEWIADYYGTEKSHYKRNETYSKGGHEGFKYSVVQKRVVVIQRAAYG